MESYVETINLMREIQRKTLNHNHTNAEEIRADYFKTIDLVWKGLKDLGQEDLTHLYQVHRFLIEEVFNIHRNERSQINEDIFKESLNIKQIKDQLEDGKQGHHIYSFNDDYCEYYVIGDIHSDTISIQRILEKTSFFNKVISKVKIKLIFLGDYVDRGKAHLKTLQCVLTLKYLFPQNIYLQRGNHDGGFLEDGTVKMWVRKPDADSEEDWFLLYLYNLSNSNKTLPIDIIDQYLSLFNSLGNISFICHKNITLMLTHGGIPRPIKGEKGFFSYINRISDLTNESILDDLNGTIVKNMMWSDPSVVEEDLREDSVRFRFTETHFEEFRKCIGFDIFVRGHQAEPKGYHKVFRDGLITIFSSGSILVDDKNINNETAYSYVEPKMLHVNKDGEVLILDLNS